VAGAVGPRAQRLSRGGCERFAHPQSLPRAGTERLLDRIRLTARTLEEQPGLTSAELAERVGYGRRHMSLLLLRLEEGGHVVHDGRRWFPGPGLLAERARAALSPARDPAKSRISC
jgi:DNA-binding IclR family transcriptional regulator